MQYNGMFSKDLPQRASSQVNDFLCVFFIPFCVYFHSVRQMMSRKTHVRHEEVRESDNNRITDTFNSLTGGTFRLEHDGDLTGLLQNPSDILLLYSSHTVLIVVLSISESSKLQIKPHFSSTSSDSCGRTQSLPVSSSLRCTLRHSVPDSHSLAVCHSNSVLTRHSSTSSSSSSESGDINRSIGEIRAFRDPPPSTLHPPPPLLSLSAFLSLLHVWCRRCLSRQAAARPPLKTAYLIAAGWLLALDSAAGTGLREQVQGQMHKSFPHTWQHTHTHTRTTHIFQS